MTTFDPPTKSDAVVLREYFRRDGQSLDEFHAELKELTDSDMQELAGEVRVELKVSL